MCVCVCVCVRAHILVGESHTAKYPSSEDCGILVKCSISWLPYLPYTASLIPVNLMIITYI